MSSEHRRISRGKNKKHRHIFLILLLILFALFLLYREFGENEFYSQENLSPETSQKDLSKGWEDLLPKVAIVIDDLGPSRQKALEVFHINVPFTLSVLPHESSSRWIAQEGYSLGFEVIGHIPMEAKKPMKLGKGGLYLQMTDDEIIETLSGAINALPNIQGISNHMGSALTEDRQAMQSVLSVLHEYKLFFLDSLTSAGSVGYELARSRNVRAMKRDVFLDYKDDAVYIGEQWEKLVRTAEEKGYAIGIAHPRKNTLEFFKKTLPSDRVTVVPLSELLETVNF
ncbi:MAG: divergent polysaccharide deacetylase family protein [Nitrospiraceae bacterium]|nr:MAG: divergent polysaccharide deacetylase family protein [Nitrospiraceae bacterium]